MAAIAFDTLKCARTLIEAGVPREQAEAQAQVMSEAFIFNIDAIVTKDYLDARFAQQQVHVDSRFERLDGELRLIKWTLAVIVAATVLPALQQFLA